MKKQYSPKSDVWVFGVTLIEIFTGQAPFPGEDPLVVAANVGAGNLVPPAPKHCPPLISKILAACFVFKVEERVDFEKICEMLS